MYNNSEIAKRALQRASEIKAEKKRKQHMLQNGAILSVFTAAMISAVIIAGNTNNSVLYFDYTPIPLTQAAPETDYYECLEYELNPYEELCETSYEEYCEESYEDLF